MKIKPILRLWGLDQDCKLGLQTSQDHNSTFANSVCFEDELFPATRCSGANRQDQRNKTAHAFSTKNCRNTGNNYDATRSWFGRVLRQPRTEWIYVLKTPIQTSERKSLMQTANLMLFITVSCRHVVLCWITLLALFAACHRGAIPKFLTKYPWRRVSRDRYYMHQAFFTQSS